MLTSRLRARAAAAGRGGEDGFTLVEVIVAMVVIGSVLIGLAGLQLSALTTTTDARQRQQATAAGNAVLEQLRTLPYDKLAKGTTTASVTALHASLFTTYGEQRVALNDAEPGSLPPLLVGAGRTNVTTTVDTATGSVSFESRAYVSRPTAAALDAPLRLTVVTTWSSAATKGRLRTVVLRSEAFAPEGCLGTDTRPFSGPCQAFLYADAVAQGGVLAVSGADGAPLLQGNPATSVSLSLLNGSSGIAAEQTTGVTGRAQTSGGVANDGTTVVARAGQRLAVTAAGDDAGNTAVAPTSQAAAAPQSAGTLVVDGDHATLTATPAPADAGSTFSTVQTPTAQCPDLAGLAMTDQPCSRTTLTPSGSTRITLDLKPLGGVDPPSFDIVEVPAPAVATKVWSGRYVRAPGSSYCTSLVGAGCMAAGAQRALGAVRIGRLPDPAQPPLLALAAYEDRVVTENGPGQVLAPAPTRSRAGTLTSRGSAFSPAFTLSATTDRTATLGPAAWTDPSGQFQVTVTGTVTVKPSLVSAAPPAATCLTACVKRATVPSVTVALRYTVRAGAAPARSLDVTVDLGALVSTTTYKAAPSG